MTLRLMASALVSLALVAAIGVNIGSAQAQGVSAPVSTQFDCDNGGQMTVAFSGTRATLIDTRGRTFRL